MALLEAVVFPQDHRRLLPCCRSRGTSCALCGYGVGVGVAVAGEFEGIERGVVAVQDDGEPVTTLAPHGSACCAWADVAATSWAGPVPSTLTTPSARRPAQQDAVSRRRRRRRRGSFVAKAARDVEAATAESQRLNHIAVERNRRRQMNEYLAALRALMPPSYARRGDQASIVGGAINFVKELEQHLQSLQARKRDAAAAAGHRSDPEPFAGFFTFPQYSTLAGEVDGTASSETHPSVLPGVADVEAAVSEGHATVKVLVPQRRGQQQLLLLRLLLALQSRHGLAALHLNVTTTADQMVLYTVSLRMGDGCQLSSAGEVAAAVHDIVAGMDTAQERAF